MPPPRTIGTARSLLGRRRGVSLSDIQALIAAVSGSYWWHGEDATLSAWADRIQAKSAAIGGSGTSIGALAGRPAPLFNGSGYYLTTAFASSVTQPHSIIALIDRIETSATTRTIYDAHVTGAQRSVLQAQSAAPKIYAGTTLVGSAVSNAPSIITSTYNGASSSIVVNGASVASGNAGTQGLGGICIGADRSYSNRFVGLIADIAILPGLAAGSAQAAAIAAALWDYYY